LGKDKSVFNGLPLSDTSCAIIVTRSLPTNSSHLIRYLSGIEANWIIIVINDDESDQRIELQDKFTYLFTGDNLGGAGGFAYGIRYAIDNFKPDWIWTSDDDALPETLDILRILISQAKIKNLDVCAPIIVTPENSEFLSFPYRLKLRRTWNRDLVVLSDFIDNQAHLFNGTLFNAAIFAKIGVPNMKLFIRGDEIEFLLRAKKHDCNIATYTKAFMVHPSGANELQNALGPFLRISIPQDPIKLAYQIRNRGYIVIRYLQFHWMIIDLFRFFCFAIVRKKPSGKILANLLILYFIGILGMLDKPLLDYGNLLLKTIGSKKSEH